MFAMTTFTDMSIESILLPINVIPRIAPPARPRLRTQCPRKRQFEEHRQDPSRSHHDEIKPSSFLQKKHQIGLPQPTSLFKPSEHCISSEHEIFELDHAVPVDNDLQLHACAPLSICPPESASSNSYRSRTLATYTHTPSITPPSRNQPNSIRKISVAEGSFSTKNLYKGLYRQEEFARLHRREGNRIAEQKRRDRLSCAIQEIAKQLPPRSRAILQVDAKEQTKTQVQFHFPQMRTLDMAIDYIRDLKTEVALANQRAAAAEQRLEARE
ncbi:hypothetical protein V498_06175 [Pseudogymnoascus sp. VKM F-4517 (FW-2822)]|nr:hypothetical protein V498_06175 [Pseudogymnoascus sp. VKM F-4517 (FW-2822)]